MKLYSLESRFFRSLNVWISFFFSISMSIFSSLNCNTFNHDFFHYFFHYFLHEIRKYIKKSWKIKIIDWAFIDETRETQKTCWKIEKNDYRVARDDNSIEWFYQWYWKYRVYYRDYEIIKEKTYSIANLSTIRHFSNILFCWFIIITILFNFSRFNIIYFFSQTFSSRMWYSIKVCF